MSMSMVAKLAGKSKELSVTGDKCAMSEDRFLIPSGSIFRIHQCKVDLEDTRANSHCAGNIRHKFALR